MTPLRSLLLAAMLTTASAGLHSQPPARTTPPARPAEAAVADPLTEAARVAWRFGERNYRPSSGLIAAVPAYDFATVWDLASGLAMLYSARELGFVEESHYKQRMTVALKTLTRLKLFDGVAYNKAYQISTGAMITRRHRVTTQGYGWSATDLGRLLIWLRIVGERDPELMPAAEQVVRRLDFTRLIKDGYLWGEDVAPDGSRRVYQEGQIGYEQYAAQGFAVWGQRAELALQLTVNAIPIEIMGQKVFADKRQRDRLTSEPFVLAGLEYGWSKDMEKLARAVLAAQEERARRTGILTLVSEDAVDVSPHFFYYYCVLANGREFSIDVQEPKATVDKPRWLSTKAAFAWHALAPNAYTERVLKALNKARGANGWSSGVHETTFVSTATPNVNTAAVVMTAAVYRQRREPLLTRRGATTQP